VEQKNDDFNGYLIGTSRGAQQKKNERGNFRCARKKTKTTKKTFFFSSVAVVCFQLELEVSFFALGVKNEVD
jgi:hypothetical protein